MMFLLFAMLTAVVPSHAVTSSILGPVGANCYDACYYQGMNCNPVIATNDSASIFKEVGVTCGTIVTTPWWAEDQPSYEPSTGKCLGYIGVPDAIACQGAYPTTQRVCSCESPDGPVAGAIGAGYSSGYVNTVERTMFSQIIPLSSYGVMTHMWLTPENSPQWGNDSVVVRYYIDNEKIASIQFTPSLAAGVGFSGQGGPGPWGTKWFGKGAKTGAWNWNFKVPFQKSVRVTVQADITATLYFIVRGNVNVPFKIGDVSVPPTARLIQTRFNETVPALAFVPVISIPSGYSGVVFMHTLSFSAPNLNSLEGCYHQFSPQTQAWPGTVMSTGTEDFFDSAYYFDGGMFTLPNAGFTFQNYTADNVKWSGYRMHDVDTITFSDGYRLDWRNGDLVDAAGIKCLVLSPTKGSPAGKPGAAAVMSYGWAYAWPN